MAAAAAAALRIAHGDAHRCSERTHSLTHSLTDTFARARTHTFARARTHTHARALTHSCARTRPGRPRGPAGAGCEAAASPLREAANGGTRRTAAGEGAVRGSSVGCARPSRGARADFTGIPCSCGACVLAVRHCRGTLAQSLSEHSLERREALRDRRWSLSRPNADGR